MNIKKFIFIILTLILLSQAVALPLTATEARADTRVTITFAAGGVVCGVFFFLQFTVGGSMLLEHPSASNALFDRGKEGWEIKFPSINIMQNEEPKIIRSAHSQGIVQMELLKFRF